MKQKICITCILYLFLWGVSTVSGQDFSPVSKEKSQEILTRISSISKQIETLECNFVQYRTVAVLSEVAKSEGKMYYKRSSQMRWEYQNPDPYCFVVSNGKSVLKKNGKTDRGNGARIFGEISKMILTCISGSKLVDETKFIPTYTIKNDVFRVTLVPRSSRMAQVISCLVMDFNVKQATISSLEMVQKKDVTRIEFKDRKLNMSLPPSLFEL